MTQQGLMHGYPSLVWVGRVTDVEGHLGIWAGAVGFKRSKNAKKLVAKVLDGHQYLLPQCECM